MHTKQSTGGMPRREAFALAAILLVALALRVAFTLASRANPYFLEPAVDQGFWVEWGRAIAHGGSHGEAPFPHAPLYAYALGAIFALSRDSLLAARLAQDVLGTLAVALVYGIARRAFGIRAALAAACLAATSWVLIYYDNELVRDAPNAALILLALFLALRLDERPSARLALATGAAFGVAALLRPQVLAFVPVLVSGTRGVEAFARVRASSSQSGSVQCCRSRPSRPTTSSPVTTES